MFIPCYSFRLYMLSRRVLKDEYLAYKSALFFAISPASILMASPVPDAVVASAAFAAFNLIEKVGLCVWSGIYLALATASSVAGIPTGLLYVMYSSMRTVSKAGFDYRHEMIMKFVCVIRNRIYFVFRKPSCWFEIKSKPGRLKLENRPSLQSRKLQ